MQSVAEILSGPVAQPPDKSAPRNKELDEVTRMLVGSVFYGTLLKTMRASEMKGKYGHGGRGEEVFGAQLDAMLAERAGKGTRGGLAEALYKHLNRQQRQISGAKLTSLMGGVV